MKRVLFIRGGAIGDFVLTLPVLEGIRHEFPGGETAILGYPHIAELAVGRRLADAVRRVAGVEWAPLFSATGVLGPVEREYLAGFDGVVCIWPDRDGIIRNNLKAAGARKVTHADPIPPEGALLHATTYVLRQCREAGLAIAERPPRLYPSERDRWWAERFMRVTYAGERPALGIHPGSGALEKNWPAACFVEVAQDWIERRHGSVLVFAGPADADAVSGLRALTEREEVSLLRDESLPRVAALIERCEAFVGNDSGITHMAAAVGTPTIAIFGPTSPTQWRPLSPRSRVVYGGAQPGGIAAVASARVIQQVESLLQ